jgi:hypothetical protein
VKSKLQDGFELTVLKQILRGVATDNQKVFEPSMTRVFVNDYLRESAVYTVHTALTV